ncbi:MAG: ABC transporter substrate-binding protein [Actinobacteria bacterium 13_1_20CM_3_71_11]|nr:MAG: ABC transporter substrate-binding protein [Actinobacteria bacterium 13_1_20CM_3_71_11]
MPRRATALTVVLAALTLALAGCNTARPVAIDEPSASPSASDTPPSKFFNQADFDLQLSQRRLAPQGDPNTPWLEMIQPSMVDTSRFAKPGKKWHLCFSNAGVGNPWRVNGLTTMKAEGKLHPEISEFTVADANSTDDKQVADINDLLTKNCDALIVSPNTTEPLTPAVQKACAAGIPVVVFDRGVKTDCPVTFIHPIGGYAFGATGAEFISVKAGRGGKVLALRLLPGVDVLENRWAAAKAIFDREGINVVGDEFINADNAKAKAVVKDYLQRYGKIDGVWMDAGFASVTVAQVFQEAGKPWRTAVIAATWILSGKQVPKEWVLPAPVITDDTLSKYVTAGMPASFYPTCGCQKMPGFPKDWGGKPRT